MRYDTSQCTGKCKTCKVAVEPSEIRCEKHQAQFQKWLAQDAASNTATAYTPRLNGVSAWERGAVRGLTYQRERAPAPGESLKFDD